MTNPFGTGNKTRKILALYRVNYGFEPPYTVLVDGPIIQEALTNELYLKHSIPQLLGASTHIVVTACVVTWLRQQGESHSAAALFAKRAARIPCVHEGQQDETTTITECLTSKLRFRKGDEKLMLASADRALLVALANVPGIPVISVAKNNKLVLRPPTRYTLDSIAKQEMAKSTVLSAADQALVNKAREAERAEREAKRPTRSRRKRAKGPNPLAVKKSKSGERRFKQGTTSTSPDDSLQAPKNSKASVYSNNKKKRKRSGATSATEVGQESVDQDKIKLPAMPLTSDEIISNQIETTASERKKHRISSNGSFIQNNNSNDTKTAEGIVRDTLQNLSVAGNATDKSKGISAKMPLELGKGPANVAQSRCGDRRGSSQNLQEHQSNLNAELSSVVSKDTNNGKEIARVETVHEENGAMGVKDYVVAKGERDIGTDGNFKNTDMTTVDIVKATTDSETPRKKKQRKNRRRPKKGIAKAQ